MELTVPGDAHRVAVVGSMNNWGEPMALERCDAGGNVFFSTTLYVPRGEYEYRFLIDGVEKLSGQTTEISMYDDRACDVYDVAADTMDLDGTTLFLIRWLRGNTHGGFDVIEGATSLDHAADANDVGHCLRAEVRSYVNGELEASLFDISPLIGDLSIVDSPVILPGLPEALAVAIVRVGKSFRGAFEYSGGNPGAHSHRWLRIGSDGLDPVVAKEEGPTSTYEPTAADEGCVLRYAVLPTRSDGLVGAWTIADIVLPKGSQKRPLPPSAPEEEASNPGTKLARVTTNFVVNFLYRPIGTMEVSWPGRWPEQREGHKLVIHYITTRPPDPTALVTPFVIEGAQYTCRLARQLFSAYPAGTVYAVCVLPGVGRIYLCGAGPGKVPRASFVKDHSARIGEHGYNLVFDLDDTLVFDPEGLPHEIAPGCELVPHTPDEDFAASYCRPHARAFLALVCQHFAEVRVCTFSGGRRALPIVRCLDPAHTTLRRDEAAGQTVFAREDLVKVGGPFGLRMEKRLADARLPNGFGTRTVVLDDNDNVWALDERRLNQVVVTRPEDLEGALAHGAYMNGEDGGLLGCKVLEVLVRLALVEEGRPDLVIRAIPASRKINRRCYVCKRPYTGRYPIPGDSKGIRRPTCDDHRPKSAAALRKLDAATTETRKHRRNT
eukprot:TRINITY_DN16443_c0_g1_i1.p1 TRINITY_DN16443_c0_g1~~TRINITY_DN16443_c0_g1_i1.p1  ORF type:complete len:723 (-),score=171.27 TRINITY_DN16443_c0_g1_i1:367-2358(-)